MIGVVDLGISNVGSVLRAFGRLGAPARPVRDAATLGAVDGIVLPGVGAFGDGIAALRSSGMLDVVRDSARIGKPLLGICLGMQLLAEASEENGEHAGLGLIAGRVVRLAPNAGERVPNIGWCDVDPVPGARLFAGLPRNPSFYFVHGFHLVCRDPADVAARTRFGDRDITAAVQRGRIFGLQFHPEKSQDSGLAVLESFVAAIHA